MQVQASIGAKLYGQIEPYDENPYPHTDGPSPRELRHQGPGHDDDVKPDECETCGSQLAALLRELHVGGWCLCLHLLLAIELTFSLVTQRKIYVDIMLCFVCKTCLSVGGGSEGGGGEVHFTSTD